MKGEVLAMSTRLAKSRGPPAQGEVLAESIRLAQSLGPPREGEVLVKSTRLAQSPVKLSVESVVPAPGERYPARGEGQPVPGEGQQGRGAQERSPSRARQRVQPYKWYSPTRGTAI